MCKDFAIFGVILCAQFKGNNSKERGGNQDDIFILYSTFYSGRSTGNMGNDRLQRIRRREVIAMLKFIYSVAAVATIACFFI